MHDTIRKLKAVAAEWCEAQSQYDAEVFPGGFPKYYTARRLYLAGTALYAAAGVEPRDGRYHPDSRFFLNTDGTPKARHDE